MNFKQLDKNPLEFPFINSNSSQFKWTILTKPCLLLSALAYGGDYNFIDEIKKDIKSIYI